MWKRRKGTEPRAGEPRPGRPRVSKVGGQVFRHASGLDDPVAVIAEHSLAEMIGEPDAEFEAPHGYRARSVSETASDRRGGATRSSS